MASTVVGNPDGNAVAIARLQILAVSGAPIVSRACTTNDADSALLLRKYCEKPPLFTSDSRAQMAENTFCGRDCSANSCFPNFVFSDSDKSIKIRFLFMVADAKLITPIGGI